MAEEETKTEAKRALIDAAAHLPAHIVAGVRGLKRWDDLYPVTDAELEAAVREFQSIKLG